MIAIVPYDLEWRKKFAAIGTGLRAALGDLALRIDHIGSTAVPGLAAKDLIDVQITVAELSPAVETAVTQAGYRQLPHITQDHVPPGYPAVIASWIKCFFKSTDPAVNIHVRLDGGANQRYALLFRDYLRAHPPIAGAYAQVKQALVAHKLDDPDAYYDVKDPVCDIIIGGAEEWAVTTIWQPGPSDC